MKRILLCVVTASLSLLSVGAQTRSHDVAAPLHPMSLTRADLPATTQEMKRNTVASPVAVPMKSSSDKRPFYRRPAGAFFAYYLAKNGCGLYCDDDYSFLVVRPFSKYTYHALNVDNYSFFWPSDVMGENDVDTRINHVVSYDDQEKESPKLCFSSLDDENGIVNYFQYPAHYAYWANGGDDWWEQGEDNPIVVANDSHLLVIPAVNSAMVEDENTEFLLSSKTLVDGSFNVDLIRCTGTVPYGTNEYGWWFGKNSGHIDGIAQAFEKPTYPYLLKKVYLQADPDMRVNDDVVMTCRVYRLDRIPSFVAGGCATLPEVPGKLIVFGEALVTPSTAEEKNGLIEFTLFSSDEYDPELVYEYCPTIDYPILICIDGYNDPEMENLEEFSAFVSTNWNDDEGYGELAYVKCPIYEVQLDENGDTIKDSSERPITTFNGHYYWSGLNNFFGNNPMEMKTGMTIFIATERPYLRFNSPEENGKYEFGTKGGVCDIEFYAWMPSHDDDWTLMWNGSEELPDWLGKELVDGAEELPDWLDIELVDGAEDGHFNNIVTAHVTAAPLPWNLRKREAVIRFGFPGAYLDYRFIQRIKLGPCELGQEDLTISVLINVVDLILNDMYDNCYDVNMDSELNIADVNFVIDYLLRK